MSELLKGMGEVFLLADPNNNVRVMVHRYGRQLNAVVNGEELLESLRLLLGLDEEQNRLKAEKERINKEYEKFKETVKKYLPEVYKEYLEKDGGEKQ